LGGIELTRARDATRFHHFLYQWLPVLALIATLAVLSLGRLKRPLAAAGAAGAILAAAVFPWTIVTLRNDGFGGLLDEVSDRGTNLLTVALIAALFVLVVLAFFHQMSDGREEERGPPVAAFALLLSGLTLLLLLGVEFYWVKDPFWVPRFNTLNKVSFQGWTMTSVAGALGVYYLVSRPWPRLRLSLARASWALAATAVVLAGFVYPVISTYSVTNSFSNDRYLDGLRFIRNDHPGDYQGVLWLGGNVHGTPVVLEAVGDSHSGFARVSAFTGLPTLLGWPLHEFWFRGSYVPQGTRRDDVQRAYQATDPSTLTAILRRYGVEYVYVGPLEREAYGPIDLGAFAEALDTVYRNDEVTIFRVRHNQATLRPAAASAGQR
ncbi:MAG TPA: hypothetical protein VFT91_01160, partial [Dehalococcoidia bacterium]|nr:hypothetical protein [Dehalococcoidia bacterium]